MQTNARRTAAIVAVVVVIIALGVVVATRGRQHSKRDEPAVQAQRAAAERQAQREGRAEARKAADQKQRDERRQAYLRQDEELAAAVSEPTQWKALPTFVTGAYADPSGRLWFVAETQGGEDYEPEFRRSVEQTAAGQTVALRGGRVLLVDRDGRFWGYHLGHKAKHLLQCYDPKQRAWLEPRPAAGVIDLPDSEALTRYGEWADPLLRQGGFEDGAGNLYFFGGAATDRKFGVHRRSPDGSWTFQALERPSGTDDFLDRKPCFVEQPGGRITVAASYGYNDPDTCRVLHYDGNAWAEVNPVVVSDSFSSIYAVVPLKDGSVATVMDGKSMWAFWPKGALPQRNLEQLAAALQSADAAEREKASQALVAMGPTALEQVEALQEQVDSPEGQRRLEDVLRTLRRAAGEGAPGDAGDDARNDANQPPAGVNGAARPPDADSVAPPRTGELHGGRFLFKHCSFTARRRDGHARFYVTDCTDLRTNQTYREAFITVAADGTWDVVPIPVAQWRRVGISKEPEDAFEDSRGGVWLEGVLRTNPRNELEPVAPDGLVFEDDDVRFEGADGRVLSRREGVYYLFDPTAPETKPDLAFEHVLRNHKVSFLEGEREAWAADFSTLPAKLVRLAPDGNVTPVPHNWDNAGYWAIVPLRGGVVVKLAWPDDEPPPPHPFMFWDGKKWHGAETYRDLVKANAKQMAAMAGKTFLNYGIYSDQYRLAGDGRGGLWFSSVDRDRRLGPGGIGINTDAPARRLEFFDGNAWHAVSPFGNDDEILRAVGGGRGVLIEQHRADSILLATVEGGQVQTKPIASANFRGRGRGDWGSHFVDGRDGQWWVRTGGLKGQMLVYGGGELQSEDRAGYPLLFDRDGRLWAFDDKSGTLCCKLDGGWVEGKIDGLAATARMTQSPDGRLWLLHSRAVSLIELDAGQSPPALREAGRWAWNGVRNHFSPAFHDDAGRLWIGGNGRRFSRFQLPPAK